MIFLKRSIQLPKHLQVCVEILALVVMLAPQNSFALEVPETSELFQLPKGTQFTFLEEILIPPRTSTIMICNENNPCLVEDSKTVGLKKLFCQLNFFASEYERVIRPGKAVILHSTGTVSYNFGSEREAITHLRFNPESNREHQIIKMECHGATAEGPGVGTHLKIGDFINGLRNRIEIKQPTPIEMGTELTFQ